MSERLTDEELRVWSCSDPKGHGRRMATEILALRAENERLRDMLTATMPWLEIEPIRHHTRHLRARIAELGEISAEPWENP